MKTIAITNQKGGTGKTTTAYNLGIALTQQGYRVLMVDFDPQGNLSCYCGIPPEQDLDQTLTELLMKVAGEKPLYHRESKLLTPLMPVPVLLKRSAAWNTSPSMAPMFSQRITPQLRILSTLLSAPLRYGMANTWSSGPKTLRMLSISRETEII